MRLDDRLGDGEAEANPAHLTAARFAKAREGLQDGREFLLRNPCPLIVDADLDRPRCPADLDGPGKVGGTEKMSVPSTGLAEVADEAPWSSCLTSYDMAHLVLYLQLLDACADGAEEEEIAREIFGIDPLKEPARAERAVKSHLRRARWMRESGYRYLALG